MSANKLNSAVQTMRSLSDNFARSFELLPHLIEQCHDDRDIRVFNIALLTNCVAYIESEINEKLQRLQTYKAFKEAEFDQIDNACNITHIKKTESIPQKWDRIKEMEGSSEMWDEGNSVFSDFLALYSLRNEVLHYKCDYHEAGETPSKRIKAIMHQVCDEQPYGKKPYYRQCFESWCSYLLMQRDLGAWCVRTTQNLRTRL